MRLAFIAFVLSEVVEKVSKDLRGISIFSLPRPNIQQFSASTYVSELRQIRQRRLFRFENSETRSFGISPIERGRPKWA